MPVEVVLPRWGLTMREATIVRWLKHEGEPVESDEPLLEVETEKANAEIPSPVAGTVARIVHPEGAVVPVGAVLALVATGLDEVAAPGSTGGAAFVAASPLARRTARELNVDLALVTGTGPSGQITEQDVRRAAQPAEPAAAIEPAGRTRLAGMRKSIAETMTRSLRESAQVTLTASVPMAAALQLQRKLGDEAGISDLLICACARTLKHHPRLNAHLVDDELRSFDEVNVGFAVALEDGLVVPVIRRANRLSARAIAAERRRLVQVAREGRLTPADVLDGTFTITNLGMYGVDAFTPILYPPQVAILGIGRIAERPAALDGSVGLRAEAVFSLTVDHRAVDGAPAAAFLRDLAELLEDPRRLRDSLQEDEG